MRSAVAAELRSNKKGEDMAKTVATLVGAVFILVGIGGFVAHDALDSALRTHLGTVHNVVHLVSGAIALYLGMKGTLAQARTFCLVFGAVYALLGVAGFVAGTGDQKMLEIGPLHLGTTDHIIHILIGVLFLAGGLLTKARAELAGAD
jgi:uncharacterized protein DUF4383